MKKIYTKMFFVVLLASGFVQSQTDVFNRIGEIPVPQIENCGFGEFVAGVDFDGDGKTEVYAVNNMLDIGGSEEIPKIFKFEFNGVSWDSVWSATITNIWKQNSWAPLITGDWDQDGKPELIWGPANWLDGTNNPNPPRVLVFEYPGDGSDNMGLDIFGNFAPNAEWTITPNDNEEIRPFRWQLADIDSDGELELCFADRRTNYYYGVISVSDIPDNGDGSETWTLETSGYQKGLSQGTAYDMQVVDNAMYIFTDNGSVIMVKYENGSYTDPVVLEGKTPGGSWKSSSAVDVDGDGITEIFVGGWFSSGQNIYMLQPDVFETLKSSVIYNFASLLGDQSKLNGGDFGDIDNDGKMDIVFGTRTSEPRAAIVRLEYQGGAVDNPASYELSIVDSLYPADDDFEQYDIVRLANIDDDPELEILYTDGARTGLTPIVILDLQKPVSVDENNIPGEFFLSQNYPNPFNPSTTITFGLKHETNVDLRIYDVLGREVSVLINNETKSSGIYHINYNASNLTSGMYIYKISAGQFVDVRKMTLVK